jgi:hypothetical protein
MTSRHTMAVAAVCRMPVVAAVEEAVHMMLAAAVAIHRRGPMKKAELKAAQTGVDPVVVVAAGRWAAVHFPLQRAVAGPADRQRGQLEAGQDPAQDAAPSPASG